MLKELVIHHLVKGEDLNHHRTLFAMLAEQPRRGDISRDVYEMFVAEKMDLKLY